MITRLQAANDQEITFFDCAEAYGPLENERILGETMNRDHIEIWLGHWSQNRGRRLRLNSKPDHINLGIEGILKQLRTDRIDLHIFLHFVLCVVVERATFLMLNTIGYKIKVSRSETFNYVT
ncbi:aldo/keto reductase [Klebsiella oxytoca]|uniref:aldo/keto reductase n=1 Tax=Klebsiella oxytoca TaxID=571 RepID=UPI00190E7E79|nr:aldo/keto reductase [Klebsiella oxytoca]